MSKAFVCFSCKCGVHIEQKKKLTRYGKEYNFDVCTSCYNKYRKQEKLGLCFRCEYRARFLESGRRPRFECGSVESCSFGCYMYKPVKPVILAVQDGYEWRPQFGPSMISARSKYVGEPEMVLNVEEIDEGNVLYWNFEEIIDLVDEV